MILVLRRLLHLSLPQHQLQIDLRCLKKDLKRNLKEYKKKAMLSLDTTRSDAAKIEASFEEIINKNKTLFVTSFSQTVTDTISKVGYSKTPTEAEIKEAVEYAILNLFKKELNYNFTNLQLQALIHICVSIGTAGFLKG